MSASHPSSASSASASASGSLPATASRALKITVDGGGAAHAEPADATATAVILASMGVEETSSRVVHQFMEFTNAYILDILSSALVYMDHAGRTELTLADVQLAISNYLNFSFTTPPPKHVLNDLAAKINIRPLPAIPDKPGIRLPPPRFCLTKPNYKVESVRKSKQADAATAGNASGSGASTSTDQSQQQQQNVAPAVPPPVYIGHKRKRDEDEENYD